MNYRQEVYLYISFCEITTSQFFILKNTLLPRIELLGWKFESGDEDKMDFTGLALTLDQVLEIINSFYKLLLIFQLYYYFN